MAWPSPQDYNEAVQNPRACFFDPELKSGTVRTNNFGIPIAYTGGFASVYQLTAASGRTWAVRCFLKAASDQQRRYSEISQTLARLGLPYTVTFRYDAPGIRVNASPLPLVAMEWISGDLLGKYILANHGDTDRMRLLSENWAKMAAALRTAMIAHGDLQHNNVLVVKSDLKLIDYDGMYVPGLAGLRPTEEGHPNYQHPRRKGLFGPEIDYFSEWIIYLSLKIIEADPTTYDTARQLGHDDCILFNRDDFERPGQSTLFSVLRQYSSPTIRGAVALIEQFLARDPKLLPPLDPSLIPEPERIPVAPEIPWWVEQQEKKAEPSGGVPEDRETVPQFPGFSENWRLKVEMLAVCIAFVALLFVRPLDGPLGIAGRPGIGLALLAVGLYRLRSNFLECPEARERQRVLQLLYVRDEAVSQQQGRLADLNNAIEEHASRIVGSDEDYKRGQAAIMLEQVAEFKTANVDNARARQVYEAKQKQLTVDQSAALQREAATLVAAVSQLRQQMDALVAAREKQLLDTLAAIQKTATDQILRAVSMSDARIPGVGPKFRQKLLAHGIATAADVEFHRIHPIRGFGYTRTRVVVGWRDQVLQRYSSRIPQSLPAGEEARIRALYENSRASLQSRLQVAEDQVNAARSIIAQRFAEAKRRLEGDEATANSQRSARLDEISRRHAGRVATLSQNMAKEKDNARRGQITLQVQVRSVESDLAAKQAEIRSLTRRVTAYANASFARFVRSVFLTAFALESPSKAVLPQTEKSVPRVAIAALWATIAFSVVGQMWLWQVDRTPLFTLPTGTAYIRSNVPGVQYSIADVTPDRNRRFPGKKLGVGDSSELSVPNLLFGSYAITALAPGWRTPVARELGIADSGPGRVEILFRRFDVNVNSDPPGATVFEGGQRLGIAPMTLKSQTGEDHTYTFSYGDWGDAVETLSVSSDGSTVSHHWPYGGVRIETEPPGAMVELSGNDLGQTPLDLPHVRPGPVTYHLQYPGYQPTDASGMIQDGRRTLIEKELIDTSRVVALQAVMLLTKGAIKLHNADAVPIKINTVRLFDAMHKPKDSVAGPWTVASGAEVELRFPHGIKPSDKIEMDSNPSQVSIALTLATPETPAPAIEAVVQDYQPKMGILITVNQRINEVEIENSGTAALFLKSVTIHYRSVWKRDHIIELRKTLEPGKTYTTFELSSIRDRNPVELQSTPGLMAEQVTTRVLK